MADSSRKKKDSFQFNSENAENVFTDVVQINVRDEIVTLELGIRNKSGDSADVSHNVIMTLPHFMRFTKVCQNVSNDILDQMKELEK